VVTLALVVANVVLFVVELSQRGEIDAFVRRWGLVPADLGDGPAAAITLLTSTFLHAGWFHLAANMVYLAVFGPPVERRLGPARFGVLYVASGLIGSLTYALVQPLATGPAIRRERRHRRSDGRVPGAVPGRHAGFAGTRAILARGREHTYTAAPSSMAGHAGFQQCRVADDDVGDRLVGAPRRFCEWAGAGASPAHAPELTA